MQDLAGNIFAGISDDTTWNFTSAVVPYVWTQTAGGAQAWTTGTNWQGGIAPSPIAGDTMDFSTVNIAADTTLTLGADRTAQLWKFGDTRASQNWIVNAGNQMILAGTTPTIEVKQNTATLNNVVAGSSGLTKTGAGTLAFTGTGNNTYHRRHQSQRRHHRGNTIPSTNANAWGDAGQCASPSPATPMLYNSNNAYTLARAIVINDGLPEPCPGAFRQ